MSTEKDNRIEELAREKMAGKSYSMIREELAGSGMNEGEITRLLRQVDELVLSESLKKEKGDRAQQYYRIGIILAITGLVLSIAFNAGIILEKLPAMLAYSPFFAGILLMVYGRYLQRKESPSSDSGTGAIRRKRPYK